MHRKKKHLLFVLLILAAATAYGIYYLKSINPVVSVISQTEINSITLPKDSSLHFYKSGLAVCSATETVFYDLELQKTDSPIKKEDLASLQNNIRINISTKHYMLINDKYLFDTTASPFKLVYQFDGQPVWHIVEQEENGILVFLLNNNNIAEPFFLDQKFNRLKRLGGMGETSCLDTSYQSYEREFSVLAISCETPFPSTKVFHYVNDAVPYGVLSIDNEFFYRVYRQPSQVILVGTRNILCYNEGGTLNWEIRNLSNHIHQQIYLSGQEILLYFDSPLPGQMTNNTLVVYEQGKFQYKELPRFITRLQVCGSNIIGIEKKYHIIQLNNKCIVENRSKVDYEIKDLYWTEYQPQYIYVVSDSNQLYIYSLYS